MEVKLRLKIGENEFEASGSQEFVEDKYLEFKDFLSVGNEGDNNEETEEDSDE